MAVDADPVSATGGAADAAAGTGSLKQRARARGYTKYGMWGFNAPSEYFSSLKTTPQLFAARAFYVKDPADALADRQGNELKRTLNWFSVAALGTGMIVGSGIFVSTGERVVGWSFGGVGWLSLCGIWGLGEGRRKFLNDANASRARPRLGRRPHQPRERRSV